ncbi:MAG: metal-dependent phosphohydrolase [Rubrivivax sp.]|nr:MAG: metal-dependent phosphohydrolase [Rubrivivax sp.]
MDTQQACDWPSRARALLSPLYAEPHRAYHGLKHIQALLTLLDAHQHLVHDTMAVTLAIWFHDAIYDSTRKDNEELSAVLAERTLLEWGCGAPLIASVVSKIRATKRHEWTDGDPDTAVFLDFDLSILAAPEPVYEAYARQVRQEYAWVPEPLYGPARAEILRSFLNRSSLYFIPSLRGAWEAAARRNLSAELARLNA